MESKTAIQQYKQRGRFKSMKALEDGARAYLRIIYSGEVVGRENGGSEIPLGIKIGTKDWNTE